MRTFIVRSTAALVAAATLTLSAGPALAANPHTPERNPGNSNASCNGSGSGASFTHFGALASEDARSAPGGMAQTVQDEHAACDSF